MLRLFVFTNLFKNEKFSPIEGYKTSNDLKSLVKFVKPFPSNISFHVECHSILF